MINYTFLTLPILQVSKHSLGMPVGVQCVTLPWQDEKCLRVMKEVECLMR